MGDELQQFPDVVGLLDGVTQGPIEIYPVVVPPTDAGARDITFSHEIGNDGLGGSLGYAYPGGDVTSADSGVRGDADQHVAMIGEEGPTWLGRVTWLA